MSKKEILIKILLTELFVINPIIIGALIPQQCDNAESTAVCVANNNKIKHIKLIF